MRGRNSGKESVGGRTVSLVRTTRFAVNHRRLSALLDPETRAEIVTENNVGARARDIDAPPLERRTGPLSLTAGGGPAFVFDRVRIGRTASTYQGGGSKWQGPSTGSSSSDAWEPSRK